MAALKFSVFLLAVCCESFSPFNTLSFVQDEFIYEFAYGKSSLNVSWGLTLPNGAEAVECAEGDTCLDFGVAKVVVTADDHCQRVEWSSVALSELKDCVILQGHWYGGGQQMTQPWPIETVPRIEAPYVTSDMLAHVERYGGAVEAYWVSSGGVASGGVAVKVDETTPLFVSLPDSQGNDSRADELCLASKYSAPYAAPEGRPLGLTYYLCSAGDVREVHQLTYPKFYELPYDVPDERAIELPIWSTWAEYGADIDQIKVKNLASMILANSFNSSQIEIDDDWETCYGDAVFNPDKFPDPQKMIDDLHVDGFRVTLWIHPFINNDCSSFSFAVQQGYLVKDSSGETQLTTWWNGRNSGIIDFTNPSAAAWWSGRLSDLKNTTGVDSFKFDAGEASYLPDIFALNVKKKYWPNGYSHRYVETVSQFGSMIEIRTGWKTQQLPSFIRMLDRSSIWDEFNGLRTLVPSLLNFGLVGYPFVLPDMVGGNAYGGRPSDELFIRWVQANTFMPAIQFSLLPWDYNNSQVTEISRKVTSLHNAFSQLIIDLARNSSVEVAPIARPTWWLCPTVEECLLADQQFLLGDDLLVVPVVHSKASSLQVVIPAGEWKRGDSQSDGTVYVGPRTVTIDDIDIESNVYFIRV